MSEAKDLLGAYEQLRDETEKRMVNDDEDDAKNKLRV